MDRSQALGHWDAGGAAFTILDEDGQLFLVYPEAPPGYETPLTWVDDHTLRVESGPYAGSELRLGQGDGQPELSVAGIMPLRRLDAPSAAAPGTGLRPPDPVDDVEHLAAYERIWDDIAGHPDGRLVRHSALDPLHGFVRWLTDRDEVIFHGSNDDGIEEFLPIRKSMEMRDTGGRGNLGAVYGTHVGLWAMFFAVVDRKNLRGSIRNGVGTYHRRSDRAPLDLFQFSIADVLLPERPYTTGALYLLPRAGFRRLPIYPGGPPSNEWACTEPVRPLARIRVRPEDFPFLDRIGGHDDGQIIEYQGLWRRILDAATRARRTEGGVEMIVDLGAETIERYTALGREIHPDVTVTCSPAEEGVVIEMTGPAAFLHTVEQSLRDRLGN